MKINFIVFAFLAAVLGILTSPEAQAFSHDPCGGSGKFAPDALACKAKRAEFARYQCCVVEEGDCRQYLTAHADVDTATAAMGYACSDSQKRACKNSGGHFISKAGTCMKWSS